MRLVVLLLALAFVPVAGSQPTAFGSPVGLRAFMLEPSEAVNPNHTFAEMPAFSWHPVAAASHYQLQLADNRTFSDVSILYQELNLQAPVASIPLQLPWMNGDPYALWVHVRAIVHGHTTQWSTAYGFNMGWQNVPQQESAPTGLIRWTPVDGATGYQVWYTNIDRVFTTLTNVADEREYWTLHPGLAGEIRWRVRAIRQTTTSSLPDGIGITPYGPWSPTFTTLTSGSITSGPLKDGIAIADVQRGPESLMPGFAWSGTNGKGPEAIGDRLWRVYVFSDKRCINPVMVGSLTGAPAWAPRVGPSQTFPTTLQQVQDDSTQGTILPPGNEGSTFMADLTPVTASEDATGGSSSSGSSSSPSSSSSSSSGSSPAPASGTTTVISGAGQIELPDSGWPTGRYWWTVVPVLIWDVIPSGSSSSSPSDTVEYHDAELPQDACQSGRVWSFSLRSAPVTTAVGDRPYASGLAVGQRLVAAATRAPSFARLPLITWKPALGAQSYEIQLSRRRYPWSAVKSATSPVTSAVLPLSAGDRGTWFYRVRGVNPNLPANAQKMTWSNPVEIRISGNVFSVIH